MSETILLVGHGSRDPEGVAEFLHFATQVQTAYGRCAVRPCFLEFARPSISDAAAQAVAAGADELLLMPLFLFAARHMNEDIAAALRDVRTHYPHIPIRAARHVGPDERMLALLDARMSEAQGERAGPEDNDGTVILLVGRGSRRPEGNVGIYEVAERLRARRPAQVAVGFAGLASPSVDEGIEQCIRQGAERVVVLPYLLFAGVLSRRVTAAVQAAQARYPAVDLCQARPLGGHRQLLAVVTDRIEEAMTSQKEMAYVA